MNLNYAIFRSEPIYTLKDLAQIGSHNKREKKAYNSNPDIVLEKTKDNIELKPLADKYVKGFYNITEEYKKEHDERMKTERTDRKKTRYTLLVAKQTSCRYCSRTHRVAKQICRTTARYGERRRSTRHVEK